MKRIFRIRDKINIPGTISHIIQRAPGKELLFVEKADYLYMLHLMKETSKKFSLDIFAYVLMPNHLHLLLKDKRGELSIAIKSLLGRYGKYFNWKYERKGHVFGDRFRQSVCLDESYFLVVSLYIHLNPLLAGLVKKLDDYPWSSYRVYCLKIRKETFINHQFLLNMINRDISKARNEYYKLLNEAATFKLGIKLDEEEIVNALQLLRNKFKKIFQQMFKKETPSIKNINLEEELEDKINKFKDKRYLRQPNQIQARKYLIEQLIAQGYKIHEIAKKLNLTRQCIYGTLKFTI